MEKDIKVIDPYMAWAPKAEGIKWHLPYESPMKVVGFAWFDKNHSYQHTSSPSFPHHILHPHPPLTKYCFNHSLPNFTAS